LLVAKCRCALSHIDPRSYYFDRCIWANTLY